MAITYRNLHIRQENICREDVTELKSLLLSRQLLLSFLMTAYSAFENKMHENLQKFLAVRSKMCSSAI